MICLTTMILMIGETIMININMENETLRELLIENIIDMAGDEFETRQDWIKLAKKSNKELVLEIVNLAKYFREQNNL